MFESFGKMIKITLSNGKVYWFNFDQITHCIEEQRSDGQYVLTIKFSNETEKSIVRDISFQDEIDRVFAEVSRGVFVDNI